MAEVILGPATCTPSIRRAGPFVPFIFATKYAPSYRRSLPVRILAAHGLKRFHQAMKEAFGDWVEPEEGRMIMEELPCEMPTAIQVPPFIVRSAQMPRASSPRL